MSNDKKVPQQPKPHPIREDRGHPAQDSAFEKVPSRVQPTQEWPRPDKKGK
jgi:hypothetical protein